MKQLQFIVLVSVLSVSLSCPYLRRLDATPEEIETELKRRGKYITFDKDNGLFHGRHPASKLKAVLESDLPPKRKGQSINPESYNDQVINSAYCINNPYYSWRPFVATKAKTCYAYNYLKAQFDNYIASIRGTDTEVLQLSNLFGAAVRLAFHDAGEIDIRKTDKMGPDGCLSTYGGNAGLVEQYSVNNQLIEPAWQGLCGYISRADFWVLVAKLSIEASEPTNTINLEFQYGRKDATSCSTGSGRLPSANEGLDEYTRVFVNQMGLTLNEAATLLGAHTLGHVHPENSGFGHDVDCSDGFQNAWDDTPHIFDNHYQYGLMAENWDNELCPESSDSSQAQWISWSNSQTIMLPSDIALGYDLNLDYRNFQKETCGPQGAGATVVKGKTKLGTGYGCSPSRTTMPDPTCFKVCDHGNSNENFLNDFAAVWKKMTTVGYGIPASVDGAVSSTGKLGALTHIDLSTC